MDDRVPIPACRPHLSRLTRSHRRRVRTGCTELAAGSTSGDSASLAGARRALGIGGPCFVLLYLSIVSAPLLRADQPAEASVETEARKKQREENLKAMEQRAREMKVHPAGARPNARAEAGAQLIPQPLFHYTDEPRRILDASLWGWTSQGRLLAICKIENYEAKLHPEGQWLYCFGSLSRGLVEAEWSDGHRWAAQKPGLELAPLPQAPAPAEGRAARLRQMKEIAKRFDATLIDTPLNRRQQMRLLPRPLYRYETPAGEMLDGAIFGLTTNGTNPDAILAVELHKTEAPAPKWMFAVAGMTQGALSVRFDEKEVWTKPYAQTIGSYETWNWFWENAK